MFVGRGKVIVLPPVGHSPARAAAAAARLGLGGAMSIVRVHSHVVAAEAVAQLALAKADV